ncbi:MAG TPA: hypothetical protein VM841_05915 [Actinomycetota bacterium]|nr:hypothetical protein [Actinomycetota bacterium]
MPRLAGEAPGAGPAPASGGDDVAAKPRRRSRRLAWTSLAATIVLAAVLAASLSAQSRMPRGGYRTIEGLTHALAERGYRCRAPVADPAPPAGVRAAAACTIGAAPVWLVTFASPERRNRYLITAAPGRPAAIAATWAVITDDASLARDIAVSFRVRFAADARSEDAAE